MSPSTGLLCSSHHASAAPRGELLTLPEVRMLLGSGAEPWPLCRHSADGSAGSGRGGSLCVPLLLVQLLELQRIPSVHVAMWKTKSRSK